MRVVVVGAGKLGYSVAEVLAREQHDVLVIDNDEERLTGAKNTLDIMTILANGASPITMNDPEVRDADLLVAATESDELNMVACILAKKHGIKSTVARVRDMQFVSEAKDFLKENFSIDLMLNPELITAREINRILMTPAALDVEDFAEGKVRLFETKVRADSEYVNVPFKDLNIPPAILAAMIIRDHRMIIPHGNDMLLPHDNAYFIGRREDIEGFSTRLMPRDTRKLERIVLIGCGRTGRFLIPMLQQHDVKIKVIEKDPARAQKAVELLGNDDLVLRADGTDIDVLNDEGIGEADVVIALTEDDKLNLMLALLAKHLGARKTIVRVARSEYVPVMEKVGVDIVLSPRLLASGEVMAFVRRGGVLSVSILEEQLAEAVEIKLALGMKVLDKPLKQLNLPKECLVSAIVRGNDTFVPNGDTVMQSGDQVILIIQAGASAKVMEYFKRR